MPQPTEITQFIFGQPLSRGYTYGRIEDAHYARNVEIRSRNKGGSDQTIACSTVDEFVQLTI